MDRRRRTLPLVIASLFLATGAAPTAARATFPDAEHVPGQVLVKWRPGGPAASRSAARSAVTGTVSRALDTPGWELLSLGRGVGVSRAMSVLSARAEVAAVQPNYIYRALEVPPDDPDFGSQWALENTEQTGGTADADIDATDAWGSSTGSSDVVVAVVDTGVDHSNADLAENIWSNAAEAAGTPGVDDDDPPNGKVDDVRGWDFVDDDSDPADETSGSLFHGTHVAGILGARGNNANDIAGVQWSAKIMPLRVLDATGAGTSDLVADAFTYAAEMGAAIANASLGVFSLDGEPDVLVRDAVEGAPEVLFVVAAGNGSIRSTEDCAEPPEGWGVGYDLDNQAPDCAHPAVFPCEFAEENVVCTAATNHKDEVTDFSNHGSVSVDLAAPGASILSTQPGDTTRNGYGTSMATPHVAGAAALLWAVSPSASVASIREAILGGVDQLPLEADRSKVVTAGRLNVNGAIGGLAGLSVAETGTSVSEGEEEGDTYKVSLNTAPSADVVVTVSSASPLVVPSPTSLTFTPTTWLFSQEVTVTAGDDGNSIWDRPRSFTVTNTASGDPDYEGRTRTVSVTFIDDDDDHIAPAGLAITGGAFGEAFQRQKLFGVGWTGADGETGLDFFSLRLRQFNMEGKRAAQEWDYDPSQRSVTFSGAPGYAYCFDVSATDLAPDPNTAGSAARCTGIPLDERAMTYKGTWSKKTGSGYYLNTYSTSKSRGAYLVTKTSARARRIYLVATKCRGCGTVEVYIGKTLLKRLSLDASKTRRKQILKIYDSATLKSGAVKIRVYSSGKPVYIEGLGLSSVRGTV